MVIIGPEQPLVEGLSDLFKSNGVPCFGPSQRSSIIESSKAFSKAFMHRHRIPTARYRTFTEYDPAAEYLKQVDHPVVLKASGLAAGKGVIIPESKEEALRELFALMVSKPFGSACDEVVIEERLSGPELSVLAFSDGYTVRMMPAAQDHKRIGNEDQGTDRRDCIGDSVGINDPKLQLWIIDSNRIFNTIAIVTKNRIVTVSIAACLELFTIYLFIDDRQHLSKKTKHLLLFRQ
jgi:hypothetical protein